jgi:hypothetical protein
MGFILHKANRQVSRIIALAYAKVQRYFVKIWKRDVEAGRFIPPNAPTVKLFAIEYHLPR